MDLFKKLDDFLDNNKIEHNYIDCCENMEKREKENYIVCISCGRMFPLIEETDPPIYLNPRFQLKTYIKYSSKFRNLCRLNMWSMDYRENTANNSYNEIKKICEDYNLNDKIYSKACFLYKYIYIDRNITSRNKIKRSLYIICIKKSASYFSQKLNIKNVLEDNGLTFKNYQKAYGKIKHLQELNF